MKRILLFGVIILLAACNGSIKEIDWQLGKWPSPVFKREIVEFIENKGRVIAVEQMPYAVSANLLQSQTAVDKFIFWDYCRTDHDDWLMIEAKQNFYNPANWKLSFTQIKKYNGQTSNTKYHHKITRHVKDYDDLKGRVLQYFLSNGLTCEISKKHLK